MSVQTSYSINQAIAYAGLLYNLSIKDIVSRAVETAAGIGFGVAVSRGTDPDKQVIVGGNDFTGITVRSLEREGAANTGVVKYSETETAAILREGYIWVTCPAGCVPGDAAFYDDTTGVIDAGTAGAGETQMDGAFFDSTAAAGQLAVLRLKTLDVTAGS